MQITLFLLSAYYVIKLYLSLFPKLSFLFREITGLINILLRHFYKYDIFHYNNINLSFL